MKFMKLGTKPDTFYTEAAMRSVLSDIPTDLIIHISKSKYRLHKFPLLLKCGLLQCLCTNTDNVGDQSISITLDEIPGGEEAFELCAKFCYGITISISASNFVPTFMAARFLRMTESVTKGNLATKLDTFFESCILQGWKDSIVTLQSAWKLSAWSESRIVQPCLDCVVQKILVQPSKVSWSYTYTRPGYNRKDHQSVPKDWWTEDVSELDLELFRSIISTVRATKSMPSALIGEALHVYTCKHLHDLPDVDETASSSSSLHDEILAQQRRILESIVTMIPAELGSVTCRFLLRLLRKANYVGVSPSTKAELIRQASRQLDEARPADLFIPLSSDPSSFDVGTVEALLENFLAQFRRPLALQDRQRMNESMDKVSKIFDSYLQLIAQDGDLEVSKFIDLATSLPDIARKDHDALYRAIDTYLKGHSEVSKTEKKQLCRLIECRKLSPDVRAQAISNEEMPLRMIVQLLFVEQEGTGRAGSSHGATVRSSVDILNARFQKNDQRIPQEMSAVYRQKDEPLLREVGDSAKMNRSHRNSMKETKKF